MDNGEFQLDNALLQLQREICTDSLEEFVKEFWDVLIDNECIWNWHMTVMADELQSVGERVAAGLPNSSNLIINVPPGSSKSTIASIMFPAWLWTRKQSLRVFSATYAQTLSNDLSLKCRTVLESDKFKKIFPDIELKTDNNQKSMYENKNKGYRFATSVGGTITGLHADVIIVDDALSAAGAGSPVELDKANNWFSSTLSTRFVDKNVGTMILIMQRLNENDCTAYLLENGKSNIKHICLPAECTDDVRPIELQSKYIDGLLDPIRMTRKYLRAFEASNGSYTYAGQFLQTPSPPSGGMFQTNEIEVVDYIKPEDIAETWRGWDKAGTKEDKKKPEACYTAGCKMARLKDGRFAVLDMVRGRWGADVREKQIKRTAVKDGRAVRIVIEQEPGSGGKESAENTIKNLAGWSIVKERPQGDKALRADPFSVQINIANVVMVKGDWNKEFINELKHFPNSRFKDQVDAASMTFARINKITAPRIRTLG